MRTRYLLPLILGACGITGPDLQPCGQFEPAVIDEIQPGGQWGVWSLRLTDTWGNRRDLSPYVGTVHGMWLTLSVPLPCAVESWRVPSRLVP